MALFKDLGPLDPNTVSGWSRLFSGPTRTDDVVLDTPYGALGTPEYATYLYVAVTGNVSYVKWDGTTQILTGLTGGRWHQIPSQQINTVGTTATGLVWGS